MPFVGDSYAHESLPDVSEDYAEQSAARARGWLRDLQQLRTSITNVDELETLEILEWDLQADLRWRDFYWLDFPLSPYTSLLSLLPEIFLGFRFRTSSDLAHYLELLNGVPKYMAQIATKLRGQIKRGVTVHREQVDAVIAVLRGSSTTFATWCTVAPARLEGISAAQVARFQERVKRTMTMRIVPALLELTAMLESEYRPHAADAVGLWRYPQGEDYYRFLLSMHVTTPVDPERAYEQAREEFASIEEDLARLRRELGFQGGGAEFHEALLQDEQWLARSPADVTRWFEAALERLQPHLARNFSRLPAAPHGVEPLPAELEASMTNGYYRRPTSVVPRGAYLFNAGNLSTTSWVWAAPLIYHELVPGHHFQIASQQESPTLPPYRKWLTTSGYVEGWAEYARSLALEMGLYAHDPHALYAHRLMDLHFVANVIGDAGINVHRWSLQQTEEFLAQDPFTRKTHRRRLALAFAVDFPGYCFGYWRGHAEFARLRRKAQDSLGSAFDVRAFHDTVLTGGTMPFATLERRIGRLVA